MVISLPIIKLIFEHMLIKKFSKCKFRFHLDKKMTQIPKMNRSVIKHDKVFFCCKMTFTFIISSLIHLKRICIIKTKIYVKFDNWGSTSHIRPFPLVIFRFIVFRHVMFLQNPLHLSFLKSWRHLWQLRQKWRPFLCALYF